MSGTLVFTRDGDECLGAIFVPEGANCEGCEEPLDPRTTVETEDGVLLCQKCAEACTA